uniref:VWFA domain-containing protein n=1 Tax=uncultured Armatimonadetes bacterium TaxID=157466 RepID=A0A6J4HIJ1_9BACT|nr:hypothetical protein AVDCRST_MAG63-644 [uncultured Armatimonadetes bacterium]
MRRKAPGDQALLVLAAEKPVVLQTLTADTEKLLRALNAARPTDATGDMREAISFAANQISSRSQAQVTVISDGAWGSLDEMSLGGATLQFLPVGKRAENVAVTAFDVRDTLIGESRQAFVTVQNFGRKPRTFPLEIRVGDRLVDAHEVTLAAGASKSETFDQVGARAGGVVSARIDGRDDLAADDTAVMTLPPRRRIKALLVSEGNLFLERALNTDPRVTVDVVAPGGYKPGPGHDLTVFDSNSAPRDLPPGRYLFWGGTPGAGMPANITGADVDKPQILDWSRTHPLMRFVDLANVHLRRARAIAPAPWAVTLAETDKGPLIVAGEQGDTRAVYVGFSVFDSDMPLRIAFPVFLANCLEWLTARPGDTSGVYHAGEVVPLAATPEQGPLSIRRPDGRTDRLAAPGTPALYDRANVVGVYEAAGKDWKQTFAVSLLNPAESNVTPVAAPTFLIADAADAQKPNAPRVPVRREVWPWIAAAVLALLTVEWLVYHRRLG